MTASHPRGVAPQGEGDQDVQRSGAVGRVLGHAVPVSGEREALRFAVAGAELPVGWLRAVPGALGRLLRDGVVGRVLVEPHDVWVWLGDESAWASSGTRVRDALAAALGAVDAWSVEIDDDAVLAHIAHDVLTGEMADYIASHGGEITLIGAASGTVRVTLGGACSHCSLTAVTLGMRLESAIRARFPALVEVRDETPRQATQLFSFLRRR